MSDTKLVKSAGEHWVCSVLSQLGWAVALTRDGIARTDILAAHTDTSETIQIQVKTASAPKRVSFLLGEKGCHPARTQDEWYVFVALAIDPWQAPRTYFVPRDHVAAATWIRHEEWRTNPNVPAGKRNTGIGRARVDDWVFARYERRWDLLTAPASAAPVMLPPRFAEWAVDPRVGLPSDHPWTTTLPAWDLSESSPEWPAWAICDPQ